MPIQEYAEKTIFLITGTTDTGDGDIGSTALLRAIQHGFYREHQPSPDFGVEIRTIVPVNERVQFAHVQRGLYANDRCYYHYARTASVYALCFDKGVASSFDEVFLQYKHLKKYYPDQDFPNRTTVLVGLRSEVDFTKKTTVAAAMFLKRHYIERNMLRTVAGYLEPSKIPVARIRTQMDKYQIPSYLEVSAKDNTFVLYALDQKERRLIAMQGPHPLYVSEEKQGSYLRKTAISKEFMRSLDEIISRKKTTIDPSMVDMSCQSTCGLF